MLVCKHADGGDRLVPVESTERIQRQQQLFGVDYKPVIRYGATAVSRWVPGSAEVLTPMRARDAAPRPLLPWAGEPPACLDRFHGSEARGMPDVE